MVETRKRHCWGCLRRRLVCDFKVPRCHRCAASGIDCPGYAQTPPLRLTWLAPGRVNFRQRESQKRGRTNLKSLNPEEFCPNTSKKCLESSSAGPESSDDTHGVALPRSHLKTDYHALIDSSQYFNSCMYPQLPVLLRLGTNSNIYKLSPAEFQLGLTRPTHLQLGLICMTLSHRMNQTSHDSDTKNLGESFYRYRGLMIRSLNDDISIPNKRNGDIVLAGILTLLMVDTQQGISQHWRYHIKGVRRLIILRGGMHRLVISPELNSVVVSADTTSPASDMFMEALDLEELYLVVKQYGGNGYGFQMCPTPLFAEIVKINHIRNRTLKPLRTNEQDFQKKKCIRSPALCLHFFTGCMDRVK